MRSWGMAVMAAALGLAACSTPQKRVRQHQDLFNAYPVEVQKSILAGQVQIGFTAEQVNMALGTPARVYSRKTPEGADEVWSYGSGSNTSVGFGLSSFGGGSVAYNVGVASGDWYPDETERIVFQNGRVVSVEQRQK